MRRKIANYGDSGARSALMRARSLEWTPLSRAGARGTELLGFFEARMNHRSYVL